MSLPRIVARGENERVFLVETRTEDGHAYGRVYDEATGILHPEFPVGSIAARGYWVESTGLARSARQSSARFASLLTKPSEELVDDLATRRRNMRSEQLWKREVGMTLRIV